MDKHILSKGFTLLEVLVAMVIITVLSLIYLPFIDITQEKNFNSFYNSYLEAQSRAIKKSEKVVFDQFPSISFSKNGNVNQAQTIQFQNKTYVIELGGGRIVQK